jgi:hypothetical protein
VSIQQTRSPEVWRHLGVLFTGAMLLFLINIWFGFDNAFTEGALPRWQALIHLHAGSIGWITLSAVGVAVWLLTGRREVSSDYERSVGRLVWVSVIVFALYIPNFGIAFSRGSGALVALLPIFGSLAVILLWWAAIFALSQLGKQVAVTTPHILAAGALLVAAIGAVMGMLLGMERVIGEFLPIRGPDRVGVHAGMMDTYLFLVAAAIIEWSLPRDPVPRWTWPGLIQGVAWALAASIVPLAFLLDMLDQLLPLFGLLLLAGLVIFLIRVAWRPLGAGPRGGSPAPWMFFGTAWLFVFLAMFLWAIAVGVDPEALPTWFYAVFAHSGFVGMMTNLILGVIAVRAAGARHVMAWGEPAALWLINLGLVFFLGLKIAADIRWGAAVMGVGVVLGVITMVVRLWSKPARTTTQPSVQQA